MVESFGARARESATARESRTARESDTARESVETVRESDLTLKLSPAALSESAGAFLDSESGACGRPIDQSGNSGARSSSNGAGRIGFFRPPPRDVAGLPPAAFPVETSAAASVEAALLPRPRSTAPAALGSSSAIFLRASSAAARAASAALRRYSVTGSTFNSFSLAAAASTSVESTSNLIKERRTNVSAPM